MTRRWNTSGECTFTDATVAASADLNDTITAGPPIGSIVAWFPNISGTPQTLPGGWALCDGSLIDDADSPLDGQLTPIMNTNNQFIRGNSTSNTSGGGATMALGHEHTTITGGVNVAAGSATTSLAYIDFASALGNQSTLPAYMNAIFIIRIK